jgi:hypothetical protein
MRVDLGALVEGVCENAVDTGGTVTFSIPRGIDVTCRPAAISRALANLVDNAIKYGGEAHVSLVSEAGRVVISIDDNGPGIPPVEREKVFAPFHRLERSRNRRRRPRALTRPYGCTGTWWGHHPCRSRGRRPSRSHALANSRKWRRPPSNARAGRLGFRRTNFKADHRAGGIRLEPTRSLPSGGRCDPCGAPL